MRVEKVLDSGEGNVSVLLVKPISVGQGTWTLTLASSYWLCQYFKNTTIADADNCTFNVYLNKGTYKIITLHRVDTTRGVLDLDIDGVEVTSIDMYAAAGVQTVSDTDSTIIVESGLKALRLRVDGKHASSSGYMVTVSAIIFQRTG